LAVGQPHVANRLRAMPMTLWIMKLGRSCLAMLQAYKNPQGRFLARASEQPVYRRRH
jgi:hypothetical protein